MKSKEIEYLGNIFRLSYLPAAIKIAVSSGVIVFVLTLSRSYIPPIAGVLLMTVSLWMVIIGITELVATRDNRKLASLKADRSACTPIDSAAFFDLLRRSNKMYCAVVGPDAVCRVGTDYISRRPPEETKRYYIDKVVGNRIQRYQYADFDDFTSRLTAFNDGGVFYVAYWDSFTEQNR